MTTSSIGTGGTYSTIQAWEDACPSNITAAGTNENWIGELKEQVHTGRISTGGITSDSTHKLILRCETGASFKDYSGIASQALTYNNSYGAALEDDRPYTGMLNLDTIYIDFEGILIKSTSTNQPLISTYNVNVIFKQCIIYSPNLNIGYLYSSNHTFENCLFIQKTSSNIKGSVFKNCTMVNWNSTAQAWAATLYSGTNTYTNCLFIGFASTLVSGNGTQTFTNCITTSSSWSAENSLTSCISSAVATDELTSYTAGTTLDARLKTGAQSIGAGTSTGMPTTDIIGQSRS